MRWSHTPCMSLGLGSRGRLTRGSRQQYNFAICQVVYLSDHPLGRENAWAQSQGGYAHARKLARVCLHDCRNMEFGSATVGTR